MLKVVEKSFKFSSAVGARSLYVLSLLECSFSERMEIANLIHIDQRKHADGHTFIVGPIHF